MFNILAISLPIEWYGIILTLFDYTTLTLTGFVSVSVLGSRIDDFDYQEIQ